MRRRPLARLLKTAVTAAVLTSVVLPAGGCLLTKIIRNRLPAPHPVEGGVLFQYEAPSARYVNLAGSFNTWCGTQTTGRFDPTIDPMSDDDGDGIWTIVKPLRPGRYQYKFVIDHGIRWEIDPSNTDTYQEGGFTNSLIIIK
ncbi:MAG TPA: glycogen-binding domain-containing protein [Candidatus Krumholzibacterium sp.]|nr:glycogen-binding domain-containing protein [Candidatus Krumholzibacterium sp.]